MRVLGPLLLTLYVVRRVRNSQTASTAAPCGPFRRGQRCGPWTAGTTLRVDPWPPTARTRVAHRSTAPGGTPPGTPRRASARPTFLKFPPNAGTLRPSACALRLPLPAGRQAAGARGREATGGAAQGGRGGAAPHAWERPRRGGDRLGASIRPPLGGYLCRSQGRSPRTRDLQVSSVLVSMLA